MMIRLSSASQKYSLELNKQNIKTMIVDHLPNNQPDIQTVAKYKIVKSFYVLFGSNDNKLLGCETKIRHRLTIARDATTGLSNISRFTNNKCIRDVGISTAVRNFMDVPPNSWFCNRQTKNWNRPCEEKKKKTEHAGDYLRGGENPTAWWETVGRTNNWFHHTLTQCERMKRKREVEVSENNAYVWILHWNFKLVFLKY